MRVRCQQCSKKISIDEAFAGGMCRCPYCGTVTKAGKGPAAVVTGARPDRPDRPDTPVAAAPAAAAEAAEAIPLARPVLIQGITALVLLGLLVAMIAFVVIFYFALIRQPTGDNGGPTPPGPTRPADDNGEGDTQAKLTLTPPVVYVIDCSAGMSQFYDPAGVIVRISARQLGAEGRFRLLVVRDDGVKALSGDWTTGGSAADEGITDFVNSHAPGGATDLTAAVTEAIKLSPKTVLVLAAKSPGEPAELAALAKSAGCAISCVSLGGYVDVTGPMDDLAQRTGGKCLSFTNSELANWIENADLP